MPKLSKAETDILVQIQHEIQQALADCNLEGMDICHQLAELHEDYKFGEVEANSIDNAVEAILEKGNIAEFLVREIKISLVETILYENDLL